MADVHTPERRSYNMSRIKGKNTRPEVQLRSMLHASGFRFRKNVTALVGKPDIVLTKYKAIVQVHGCFWHRHEGCRFATCPASNKEFWIEKFRRTIERDSSVRLELERGGWSVLTVWECSLRSDPQGVMADLKRQLMAPSQSTTD